MTFSIIWTDEGLVELIEWLNKALNDIQTLEKHLINVDLYTEANKDNILQIRGGLIRIKAMLSNYLY